ncbi:MAG: sigma-70 family RNA polymerase sigma factor [Erysipelotrichaceae bacterium]|nr:sigma-70 family RNA polymerase sigma factor [Erysipelotrichaceae bacterium]
MEELEKIIEKVKQGDDQSFKQLYDLTYKKAYIIALSFMKDETRAKDALQLAYVKLANKIDMVNNVETFQGWFNTIVANTCKDELDKRQEFSFSDYEDYNDQSIDIEDDSRNYKPDENVKYEDDREVVVGFINELPVDQRTALVMQIYEEMKISEIADVLGTNENTIKSRLNYAKKTLKTKIEEYKKAGNTLFVLPLIPYLQGIFKSYEETITVDEKLYVNIASEVSNVLVPQTIAEGTTKQALKTAGKKAGSSILTKVVAAALAVGVAFGGYSYFNGSNNSLNNSTEETTPTGIEMYDGLEGKATLQYAMNYFSENVTSYTWVFDHYSSANVYNKSDIKYCKIYKGDDGYIYGTDINLQPTGYYSASIRRNDRTDFCYSSSDNGLEEYDYEGLSQFYSFVSDSDDFSPYTEAYNSLGEMQREDINGEIILTYTYDDNNFTVKINEEGYIYYVEYYVYVDQEAEYGIEGAEPLTDIYTSTYSNFNDEFNVFDFDEQKALYQSCVGQDSSVLGDILAEWDIE